MKVMVSLVFVFSWRKNWSPSLSFHSSLAAPGAELARKARTRTPAQQRRCIVIPPIGPSSAASGLEIYADEVFYKGFGKNEQGQSKGGKGATPSAHARMFLITWPCPSVSRRSLPL